MRLLTFLCIFLIVSCEPKKSFEVENGVSKVLAESRVATISKVNYELQFSIPSEKSFPILGKEKIGFELKSNEFPIVLDFNVEITEHIHKFRINGSYDEYDTLNGHIILPAKSLKKGYNTVSIEFKAGDMSLNRNDDYLYTLFVPDRASTAFPCFDQPDLKARYKLSLDVPKNWVATSNGTIISEEVKEGRKKVDFEKSDLISTYLFSFVAGEFTTVTKEYDDITMTMLHRETDTEKIDANIDEIFSQHYDALKWLEDYTDIKYPFQKFDFALIPGFQYGGMEHVGAIQYRSSRLMLEPSSTLDDKINRTMLIAHETAHMWFGNLVTMKWFDDVWLKEVFANFMASKFTEPRFPEVSHDLNFLFAHYPQAYAVDRTEGTNSIRQNLDNLKDAGNMYGAIIYHKAPIVMKQLEKLLGKTAFRLSLQEYLYNYQWKNATWDDLIKIFDLKSDENLVAWSKIWIDEPGMPFIDLELVNNEEGSSYDIIQYDLTGRGRVWPQYFSFDFTFANGTVTLPIFMNDAYYIKKRNSNSTPPQLIQLNTTGLGYGTFSYGLNYVRDEFLFEKAKEDIPSIADSLKRGAACITLHEYLLYEGMNPQLYLSYLEEYVRSENDKLILSYLLGNLELIFWKFLKPEQWKTNAPAIEQILWDKIQETNDIELKHIILKKYISMAHSEKAVKRLLDLWNGVSNNSGLTLSESESITIAYHIALKGDVNTDEIIQLQLDKLKNPDRKAKMKFVSRALSNDEKQRDEFFNDLLRKENRAQESWVTTALYYLHHPIRTKSSLKYLKQSLEVLPELQKTGDIFFPKRWLDNTFWGYNSRESIGIINEYLTENPDLNPQLKSKLLQVVDMVFRAERDISDYYARE